MDLKAQNEVYLIDAIKVHNVSCFGLSDGKVELLVVGGTPPYTFNGIPGDKFFLFDNLTSGSHDLFISDSDNNDTILNFVITEPEKLEANVKIYNFCDTNLIKVYPIGGTSPFEYEFNGSIPFLCDTAYFSVSSGDFPLILNDNNECSFIDTITIDSHKQIEIHIDTIIHATCLTSSDGKLFGHIEGGQPSTFSCNYPIIDDTVIIIENLHRGSYLVEISDNINCGNSHGFSIQYKDSVYVDILKSIDTVFYGKNVEYEIDYHSSSEIVDFSWTPSLDLSCTFCESPVFTPMSDEVYILYMVDENGCYDSDTLKVEVVSNILYMPNAFSPNNDGLNDKFLPTGYIEGVTNFNMLIFARNGQFIGEISDPYSGWDGKFNANECQMGTYVWRVVYEFEESIYNKGVKVEQGVVTLVR